MSTGLWAALAIVLLVIVYVVAKVLHYQRQSEADWRAVDKSKLREWDDEDEW